MHEEGIFGTDAPGLVGARRRDQPEPAGGGLAFGRAEGAGDQHLVAMLLQPGDMGVLGKGAHPSGCRHIVLEYGGKERHRRSGGLATRLDQLAVDQHFRDLHGV